MGLDVLEVEEAEYAVVELVGSVPECIHNGWKYAMEVFFPEHGYVHSGKSDLNITMKVICTAKTTKWNFGFR